MCQQEAYTGIYFITAQNVIKKTFLFYNDEFLYIVWIHTLLKRVKLIYISIFPTEVN